MDNIPTEYLIAVIGVVSLLISNLVGFLIARAQYRLDKTGERKEELREHLKKVHLLNHRFIEAVKDAGQYFADERPMPGDMVDSLERAVADYAYECTSIPLYTTDKKIRQLEKDLMRELTAHVKKHSHVTDDNVWESNEILAEMLFEHRRRIEDTAAKL